MKYDYALVIGRFQLPHHGHFELFKKALEVSDRLIIGIGSSNLARSLRNPFSFEQRASFIENCEVPELTKAFEEDRVVFVPLEDSPYSDLWWVENVQRQIKNVTAGQGTVALVGCKKDNTSYYLDMFPQWTLVEHEPTKDYAATKCREMYYRYGAADKSFANQLNDFTTAGVLTVLMTLPQYVWSSLNKRFLEVEEYQKQWGKGPFNTVDAVVLKKGHVLMIKRKDETFNRDLWALPGGFIEDGESTNRAVVRELLEETELNIDSFKEFDETWDFFSGTHRDDRAEINTYAYLFQLPNEGPLPTVEGKDDAEDARWIPLVDITSYNCYADHYFIIRKMLSLAECF